MNAGTAENWTHPVTTLWPVLVKFYWIYDEANGNEEHMLTMQNQRVTPSKSK